MHLAILQNKIEHIDFVKIDTEGYEYEILKGLNNKFSIINFIMFDGKKETAEKIIYTALDKIKNKTKEDPIKVFNEEHPSNIISPPFPPAPPSGPPNSTYFSLRKLTQPFPPLPDCK